VGAAGGPISFQNKFQAAMAGAGNMLNSPLGSGGQAPNVQMATRQFLACFANTFDPIESAIAHLLNLKAMQVPSGPPNPNFYNPYGPPDPVVFSADPTQVGAKRARYDGLQFDGAGPMDGFGRVGASGLPASQSYAAGFKPEPAYGGLYPR